MAVVAVGGVAAALLQGLPVAPVLGLPGHGAAAGTAARLTAYSTASAAALASAADQPVEVLADRTDYSQTFADPGGGFTFDESPVPVRVQQGDGSWVPVDTTLSVQPDGLVAPAAITTGLVLSGGGSGPLYTLTEGGNSVAVSWPDGPLPVPSLAGATATYADVLPGVNLLVSATPTGVSELLQVTSVQAAANPALALLAFPVASQGLTLSADGSGAISAADGSGMVRYAAAPPQMWDSAGSQAPGGPTAGVTVMPPSALAGAAGPVPGDHVATVGLSLAPGSLSLAPLASLLLGSSTVYPVYIDPEVNTGEPDSWSDVWKKGDEATGGDWEYQDASFGGIRAGVYCQPDSNGNCLDPCCDSTWGTYRSFMFFSIPSYVWDSQYVDAQLQTTMMWAWACHPGTQVNLYWANTATRGMSWPGPGEKQLLDTSTKAYRNGDPSCNEHGVTFDASAAARSAASNHYAGITLELRANDYDESHWNVDSWRRFGASSMNLQIDYRHAPDVPNSPGTQGVFNPATGQTITDCASSPGVDYVSTISTAEPVIQVNDTDVDTDTGGKITGEFGWTNLSANSSYTGPAGEGYLTETAARPGPEFTMTWPGPISEGDSFRWQAYGQTQSYTDGIGHTVPNLAGPVSSWCYFTPDNTPPNTAPTVTSADYSPSNSVGTPTHFQFTDPLNSDSLDGTNDVVGYYYGINTQTPTTYVPVQSGADANRTSQTVTITPFTPGEEDLYVLPVDRAGNVGPVSQKFTIFSNATSGIAELGWWKLNEGSGTTVTDSTNDENNATLWQPGSALGCNSTAAPSGYLCTLSVDGSQGRAFTGLPVVGNSGSFSVSVWVYLNAAGSSDQVALSQGAKYVPGFTLGYVGGSCTCWAFQMPSGDQVTPAPTWYSAQSAAGTAKARMWTQLTGVYDAMHGQMFLYVNGGGSKPGDGLWAGAVGAGLGGVNAPINAWQSPASGLLRLGSSGTAGATAPFWGGQLSAGCVFYGALGPPDPANSSPNADAQALWDNASGDGCGLLHTKYP
jgi:hypothetical protein